MDLTADVSCRLLEVDYCGIEAVITGWFLRDPAYIRLARLGIHAAVAAQKLGQPIDLSLPDVEVSERLKAIKIEHPLTYDICKRVVHANNYGMTTYGMVEKFPESFPTERAARETQQHYYALAPTLPEWQLAVRTQAKKLGYLGGPTPPGAVPSKWDHPYGYRRWFWDVLSYRPTNEFTARKWSCDNRWKTRIIYMHGRPYKVQLGGDSKRVIAFYPQSTAAGRLKEVELALFHPQSHTYIGDCYFGRTPLVGPIHDSLLLHLPNRCFDRVAHQVFTVMTQPTMHLPCPLEWNIGSHLGIGIAAKTGINWAPHINEDRALQIKLETGVNVSVNLLGMEDLAVPVMNLQVPNLDDTSVLPRDDDSEDEWKSLARVI